jgi:hypothetical protein
MHTVTQPPLPVHSHSPPPPGDARRRGDKTGPSAPATPPGGPPWRPRQVECTLNHTAVSPVPRAARVTRSALHLAPPTHDHPPAPAIPQRRSPVGRGRADGREVGALEVRRDAMAAGACRCGGGEMVPRGGGCCGGGSRGWVGVVVRTPTQPGDAMGGVMGGGGVAVHTRARGAAGGAPACCAARHNANAAAAR